MQVADFAALLKNARRTGTGYTALCPVAAHDDRNNSLSVSEGDDGRILLKCFGGCSAEAIVTALGLEFRDLFPAAGAQRTRKKRGGSEYPPEKGVTVLQFPGLRLEDLAQAKRIPAEFLRQLGLTDCKLHRAPAVRIPYYSAHREIKSIRYRLCLSGPGRIVWKSGSKVALYGLDHLESIRKAGWVLLVEGESDCWTAWHRNIPALGVPGKTCWKSAWKEYLEGIAVYVWQEPAAEDFSSRVLADLPGAAIIPAPDGIKDLSEAHLRGHDLARLVDDLKSGAIPAQELKHNLRDAAFSSLLDLAIPSLK